MRAGREQFNEYLSESGADDSEAIRSTMRGEDKMKRAMLKLLPVDGLWPLPTIKDTVASMSALMGSKLMMMQSVGFQGQCAAIVESLQHLQCGRHPTLEARSSSFVTHVAVLLPSVVSSVCEDKSGKQVRLCVCVGGGGAGVPVQAGRCCLQQKATGPALCRIAMS
mmetsp:Transcript_106301/g.310794  ORF Transcript_106301/g.310794 Transcript_106301/m.310794 type:complete len:166 (+) Transcript_106301:3-500(+)